MVHPAAARGFARSAAEYERARRLAGDGEVELRFRYEVQVTTRVD